jgi:uncharacterized protein YecE (DUF72 family)
MARIYVGTCSWSDHSNFYPKGLPANQRIVYYAQRFPIVEINSSYYHMMPRRNYELWAARTPEGFLFDVKPYKQLTWHDRKNPPDDDVSERFSQTLQPLRDAGKLGAVHFQFPPWFKYGERNIDYIRSARERFAGDRFAVEFRHRSWLEGEHVPALVEALRAAEISLTVVDEPQLGSGSVPCVLQVSNPELVLVRFHGRNSKMWYAKVKRTAERFNYLYSEDELREWVSKIGRLVESAREIHLLLDNNAQDFAIQNARQLRMLLSSLEGSEIVAAPIEATPRQGTFDQMLD